MIFEASGYVILSGIGPESTGLIVGGALVFLDLDKASDMLKRYVLKEYPFAHIVKVEMQVTPHDDVVLGATIAPPKFRRIIL